MGAAPTLGGIFVSGSGLYTAIVQPPKREEVYKPWDSIPSIEFTQRIPRKKGCGETTELELLGGSVFVAFFPKLFDRTLNCWMWVAEDTVNVLYFWEEVVLIIGVRKMVAESRYWKVEVIVWGGGRGGVHIGCGIVLYCTVFVFYCISGRVYFKVGCLFYDNWVYNLLPL